MTELVTLITAVERVSQAESVARHAAGIGDIWGVPVPEDFIPWPHVRASARQCGLVHWRAARETGVVVRFSNAIAARCAPERRYAVARRAPEHEDVPT
jgi:hypothetical protein